MLTGADSAESATETLKLGAWDYVVKRPDLKHLDELPAIVGRCIERIRWRQEETRLRNEMDLLLTAIRSTGDAVIMTDCERRVQFWNAAAEKLFGWRAEEVLGRRCRWSPPTISGSPMTARTGSLGTRQSASRPCAAPRWLARGSQFDADGGGARRRIGACVCRRDAGHQ